MSVRAELGRAALELINHPMRPSLGMTSEQYDALPEAVHPLLTRVFSQHARSRFFAEPHDG